MIVIYYIAITISLIGVAVLAWGSMVAIIELLSLEIKRFRGQNICRKRDYIRHHLGSYILLGLEFLIASDIIHTIMQPTLKELAILGGIVVIRTILNFFLNIELRERHNCMEDK